MQNFSFFVLFTAFLVSCGRSGEKELEDPGNLDGRIDQTCKCMEENDYKDWQPCYDLNNSYYEKSQGDEKEKFQQAIRDCQRKFKNK
jgi:hypothetical protein